MVDLKRAEHIEGGLMVSLKSEMPRLRNTTMSHNLIPLHGPSMDAQLITVRQELGRISDQYNQNGEIALSDALMSGVAMFILKDPSLFASEYRRQADAVNLKRIFGIKQPPSDTLMRELLDSVDPELIRPLIRTVFSQLQQSKALERLAFYQGNYLLSINGPGRLLPFGKSQVGPCPNQKGQNEAEAYYQQVLGAAIVHPNFREAIPFCPVMIRKKDGTTKDNSECNTPQSFLAKLREDHPELKLIVVADGLSFNGSCVRDLQKHDMHFILGAKPGNHLLLFHIVELAVQQGAATVFSMIDPQEPQITHTFRFLNGVPLNQTNRNLIVNFLGYEEHDARTNKKSCFSWVTDFEITHENALTLMRGGRSGWNIETETLHTLTNQGCDLEYVYGQGKGHLSEVLVMLMMLAFLIEQTQQLTSTLFRAASSKVGSKGALWEQQRNLFHFFELDSMAMLYTTIATGFRKSRPVTCMNNG